MNEADLVRKKNVDVTVSLLNEALSKKMTEEMDKHIHIYKGDVYLGLAVVYYVDYRFGETKTLLEMAIKEDKIQYGENSYKSKGAWKLYDSLFGDGEPQLCGRVSQIIDELSKIIPKLKK